MIGVNPVGEGTYVGVGMGVSEGKKVGDGPGVTVGGEYVQG
jgi:hypothetical protein